MISAEFDHLRQARKPDLRKGRPGLWSGCWLLVATVGTGLAADDRATPAPAPADPATYGIEISPGDREHWSFRPIESPQPPHPRRHGEWVRNPIDGFILERLQAKGLDPSPPADSLGWLRRVTFDLTGLPPTPEQAAEFLSDNSQEARERAVDRLLADPGYGVRWGRHWLDVVRYADTNGYERDGDKPQVWRYRDYVIDSLNADKPFDRFLTEQLAGDELPDANAESMIATTFLRLGTWDDEPADPLVDRYEQLDDILGTVSATFLGMTLRCARCHNHKFEPLSQIDYARMLAIFEPLKRPQNDRIELDVPVGTRQQVADAQAAEARQAAVLKALEVQIRALDDRAQARFLATDQSTLPPEALAAHRLPEGERNDVQKKLVKDTQKQLDDEVARARSADETRQREGFQAALAAVKAAPATTVPRAYIWDEPAGEVPVTQVFRRGNPTTPGGQVAPGFPAVLSHSHIPPPAPVPGVRSSQRRLSLAQWMSGPKNPLVARVIVNRLWQGHFGNGLVSTENDFGVMGSLPTHPELLDWLAGQLRMRAAIPEHRSAQGAALSATAPWSLKHIHKLIVLCSTYGQSSRYREEASGVDADNALMWRFPYRRLDAEAVRDAVLTVSGQLNPEHAGPGVYPKIAREVLEGQSRPGEGWGKFDEKASARRAIYIFVKRSLLVPELELLDFADTNTSCEQRPVSTIPTQALTLLNGEFLNQQAVHFARRLLHDAGADRNAQIERGYRLALSRAPTGDEQAAAIAFLDRQAQQVALENQAAGAAQRDPAHTALEALCLVLYNLNEFAYVD
ncbi:MAG: DUF1549 domain-containing protein [Planctomycetaceae bacterium]|nr:DUF1549 domain-containing protein [Planctomycetaceae bacterium]